MIWLHCIVKDTMFSCRVLFSHHNRNAATWDEARPRPDGSRIIKSYLVTVSWPWPVARATPAWTTSALFKYGTNWRHCCFVWNQIGVLRCQKRVCYPLAQKCLESTMNQKCCYINQLQPLLKSQIGPISIP